MKPNYVARKTAWLMFNLKDITLFLMFVGGAALVVLSLFVLQLDEMSKLIAIIVGGVMFAVCFTWYIIRFLNVKLERYEFYDYKVVYKHGVFKRYESTATFLGVLAMEVNRSFLGRILGYGDVTVDAVGRWDMDISMVSKPKKLRAYLETKGASKLAAAFAAGPANYDHFDTSSIESF